MQVMACGKSLGRCGMKSFVHQLGDFKFQLNNRLISTSIFGLLFAVYDLLVTRDRSLIVGQLLG